MAKQSSIFVSFCNFHDCVFTHAELKNRWLCLVTRPLRYTSTHNNLIIPERVSANLCTPYTGNLRLVVNRYICFFAGFLPSGARRVIAMSRQKGSRHFVNKPLHQKPHIYSLAFSGIRSYGLLC